LRRFALIAGTDIASNNGFTGTFVWSDGSATASADTFRNTANNEFAARATGGLRLPHEPRRHDRV
jgi:hypothetical protein